MEYFKTGKIGYEGIGSDNPFAFKVYDRNRPVTVCGRDGSKVTKPMSEHLRFAMSYWHTMCGDGTDMFGAGTADKSFGGKTPMEIYRNKAYAAFEFMEKLGIEFFCFHDRDIAPEGETAAETFRNAEEITDILRSEMKRTGIRLLWGTANLFNDRRYMLGAGTAASADVYAVAASQVKKALDVTMRLDGAGFVFWGGREGYDTLLNTDTALEEGNYAYLLRMAVDYARAKGFKGDFYVEPKPKEPAKHQYDSDAATAIGFLRKHGLDKDFRLNIEANHATLAGHTFNHELRVARDNGFFGSIDANEGDLLLGWDTDKFPTNVYEAALCMYEVLGAGGFTNGGLNFDAKTRRASNTPEDMFLAYIAGMDTFAAGLLVAAEMLRDGRLDDFRDYRYRSFRGGIGRKITERKTSLEELEKYADGLADPEPESGRQEYLESLLNTYIFRTKF